MSMTFTESDVKSVSDFVNFIYIHATLPNMTTKEAFTYTRLYTQITGVIKKMDANILELKKVIDKDGKITEV